VLPFDEACYYWVAGALNGGDIIVYTYNAHLKREDQTAEQNMPYAISRDGGRTWSDVQKAHFAKGIQNMPLSRKLGDLYFMHGRAAATGVIWSATIPVRAISCFTRRGMEFTGMTGFC
jgi:Neuraminidase (sialidase)